MKTGDIVQLGQHRLMCGDAFNPEHVDALMDGTKADMLYCDPPYGMKLDTEYGSMPAPARMRLGKGITGGRDWAPVIGDADDFDPRSVIEEFSACREQFWWGADYYRSRLPDAGSWIAWDKRTNERKDRMFGSAFELCWSRKKHRREIARIVWCGVFGTEREPGRKRMHPCHKPVVLAEWFLSRYSKETASVVDLFAGSGSLLLACERMNRRAFCMEISPEYCQVIIDRYRQMAGEEVAA